MFLLRNTMYEIRQQQKLVTRIALFPSFNDPFIKTYNFMICVPVTVCEKHIFMFRAKNVLKKLSDPYGVNHGVFTI